MTEAPSGRAYQYFPQTNIPGYQGFIPLRLFDCGQTFGRAATPSVRKNSIINMKEKHWRTGPAFMEDTQAYHTQKKDTNQGQHQLIGSVVGAVEHRNCLDGNIPVPRYTDTYEKPGYGGHVPMHLDNSIANTQMKPAAQFIRNVPGYTGIVPGAKARVGETFGKLAARTKVNTPHQIAGSRLLLSAHGSFRQPDERMSKPVTPPWATDNIGTPVPNSRGNSASVPSRRDTGLVPSRPNTGLQPSRPTTESVRDSRCNSGSMPGSRGNTGSRLMTGVRPETGSRPSSIHSQIELG
eukprot:TRINITY_DN9509_c0_g1_i6.p1 TRINITY_DN9509_c0_g1~~TRINITY_DN9509_c0_g1_i6.p1  ORF type:complete len:294 (+),score=8.03 TRINITY_DN9509_c0_g1_i6:194-1075(+)